MPRRPQSEAIDWDAIERQYRLGAKSNAQLGKEFGVDASGIAKRAKRLGWVQDKREDVERTREVLLIQAASGNSNPNSSPSPLEIKVAAQAGADVVLQHRQGLAKLKETTWTLHDKVREYVDELASIQEVIEILRKPNDQGVDRANDLMRKRSELPELVDMAKKVVEMHERVVKGEREAWGIDRDADKGSTMEQMLAKLDAIAPPGSK